MNVSGMIVGSLLWMFSTTVVLAQSGVDPALEEHLRLADAALAAKNRVAALREFGAALEINPEQSRAVFRMADLLQHGYPKQAEVYFRQYLELEPLDEWGPISFADFLENHGRAEEALSLYEKAASMDPQNRDAAMGRARTAGKTERTDLAIQLYRSWLDHHENDYDAWTAISGQLWRAGRPADAWNALVRVPNKDHIERLDLYDRSAAPALTPLAGFSIDTDGNLRRRYGISTDGLVSNAVRLGLDYNDTQVSFETDSQAYRELSLTSAWRPRAAIRVDAKAGMLRGYSAKDENVGQSPDILTYTARTRLRLRAANGSRLEVRFDRNLLDSTAMLVANRVMRNELQVKPSVALTSRLRWSTNGSAGLLTGGGERNVKYTYGTGLGWSFTPAFQLLANHSQILYKRPARVGYFAPARIQINELATYLEFEGDRALLVIDAGAGVQRVRRHNQSFGTWRRAMHGYALLSFPLRTGSSLDFEVEAYDTLAAPAAVLSSGWRYTSVMASFRMALPGRR